MLVARTTRLYFLIVFFSSHSLAESFSRIMSKSRGALIVLEGIDRCGKTTQVGLLQETLGNKNARVMRFPDRTTAVGKIIDQYLQSNQVLDDRAVHLLFSANRWECAERIRTLLRAGTTIVCDRYAYSGVAFSAAKVNAREEFILSLEWCQAPDRGLPAPDCVIFLDLAQDEAEKRGGYGGERYEKRDMQIRVRQRFDELQAMDRNSVPWTVINAAQSINDVQADIWTTVQATLAEVAKGKELKKMWDSGSYDLSEP